MPQYTSIEKHWPFLGTMWEVIQTTYVHTDGAQVTHRLEISFLHSQSMTGEEGRTSTYSLICGERCVACDQKVQSWSGDKGGNQSNQVIIHVAWITQCGGAGRHNGWDLAKKQEKSYGKTPSLEAKEGKLLWAIPGNSLAWFSRKTRILGHKWKAQQPNIITNI